MNGPLGAFDPRLKAGAWNLQSLAPAFRLG